MAVLMRQSHFGDNQTGGTFTAVTTNVVARCRWYTFRFDPRLAAICAYLRWALRIAACPLLLVAHVHDAHQRRFRSRHKHNMPGEHQSWQG
jgi:hypothetical protein